MRKIAVCSLGSPLVSSTWSGTPANICRCLHEMRRLGVAVDSTACVHPRVRQFAHLVSKYYYGCSYDTGRGRLYRYLRSRYLRKQFRAAEATDVLHTSTLHLPLVGGGANARHYLFCDSTWDLWRNGATNTDLYSKRLLDDAERMEQSAYRQMAHIFPISQYVRNNLISHYGISPDRITVVGTGRGAIKPYKGTKDYRNGAILMVAKGRFEDKGGPLMVEGFKLARQVRPDLKLVIVGDEKHRERVGNLQNIEVHGFVELERLQGFFNHASLFAMPAVNEPWGLVYLEALSCKTPILGLNRNAVPEITQDGRFGFCLDDATPAGIAAGLLEAFSNPERLAKMGNEGQRFCISQFTWENTVKRMVDVIDRCGGSAAENNRRNQSHR